MKKIILNLPNILLKKYVLKNFSKLSIEDFFEVSKRISIPFYYIKNNKILRKSDKVLNYALDVDIYSFQYFDPEAFSIDCINKIGNSNIDINPILIRKYPILLKNSKILERTLKKDYHVIKMIDYKDINEKIISILEKTNYIPTVEDLTNNKFFLKSEILAKRAIQKNANLILKFDTPSYDLIKIALDNGFVPNKKTFLDKPFFKTKTILLRKAFENDPSIIVFFNKKNLNSSIIESAHNRGFIAEKSDLIENSILRDYSIIMEDAIKKDPSLVAMLGDCMINSLVLEEALKKYKITKEDLERNPKLTKNTDLMEMLPEFSLYSANLSDKNKENILAESFKSTSTLSTTNLPFLDKKFGGKVDIEKINELLKLLYISIDEENLDIQQRYSHILNKTIDAIATIRYINAKTSFKYSDIVAINDSLNELFNKISTTNNYQLIIDYINELYNFVGKTIELKKIKDYIEKYYNIYLKNKEIDLYTTSEFCNEILNKHMNYFLNTEKEKIINSIKNKLKLSKKKKESIINREKMKKIENYIAFHEYEKLGITEQEYDSQIENIKNIILNNKTIIKNKIEIDSNKWNKLINAFEENGNINYKIVSKILKIKNSDITKFIAKKINEIKINFFKNINLTQEEENKILYTGKIKIKNINQTNFIIFDNDRYRRNLAKLVLKLDEESINKILDNKELIKEISFLLPFLNLTKELDIKTFINILVSYDRIKDKIFDINYNNSNNLILNKIADIISLGNAYCSVNDIVLYALGKNIVAGVEEDNSFSYLNFYVSNMINRRFGSIPPISLAFDNYYLDSGMYSDPYRLLLGKKPIDDSCIDLLNTAGNETYEEALAKESGDVILIRNSKKELISRILIFRRGNIIQMFGKSGDNQIYTFNIYKQIADKIMQEATLKGDNIDYIFVNACSPNSKNANFPLITDRRFVDEFPHTDKYWNVTLLSSKNPSQKINEKNLKFDETPLVQYQKPRKRISIQATDNKITRLRALKILMEKDSIKKEKMAREFEPFYSKNYKKVICGEDWYLAIRKDNSIEELFLPLADKRIQEEILYAKKALGIISINKEEKETLETINQITNSKKL